MKQRLLAYAAGIVFGLGLGVGGMLLPVRVQGFLDFFGRWDPTLAFVMGGAVAVSLPGMWWARRRARPLWASSFAWPTATAVDGRLCAGAALFGIGWGASGLCPGPALASVSGAVPGLFWFLGAMLAGMALHDRVIR